MARVKNCGLFVQKTILYQGYDITYDFVTHIYILLTYCLIDNFFFSLQYNHSFRLIYIICTIFINFQVCNN